MSDALILVLDDDRDLGASLSRLLGRHGYQSESFEDGRQLLQSYPATGAGCVVSDIMMTDIDGFGFAEMLRQRDPCAAIVFMTAWPTTAHAVDSIRRHGGLDYLEKPIDEDRLLAAVAEGVAWSTKRRRRQARLAPLSPRERDVFELLVRGLSNKAVAERLGLSPRTVEDHRASIMAKTGAGNIAELIDLVG